MELARQDGIHVWMTATGIKIVALFRSINQAGGILRHRNQPQGHFGVVKQKAKDCEVPSFATRDLRRVYAHLCHQGGGELEQIQFSWGMSLRKQPSGTWAANSVLLNSVNGRIGLEPNILGTSKL